MRVRLTDVQFAEMFESRGGVGTAAACGISERAVFSRRRRIEKKFGRELTAGGETMAQRRGLSEKAMLRAKVYNGVILVGSDHHYWDHVSTAHLAFLKLCRELKPVIAVANGDVLDFPRISRHPPIGWEGRPSVLEELRHAQIRLREIQKACPRGTRFVWPAGNHDLRFESRLATAASEFEGVVGTHLKDHFPDWEPCWGLHVNEDVIIKHRFKGGLHSSHNNAMWSGKTFVTGHDHAMRVQPFSDYNGTRFGVNCGTMAEPYGPQFVDYTEANPVNWRSGFAVLTFHEGVLAWPELVHVVDQGKYDFRGQVHSV